MNSLFNAELSNAILLSEEERLAITAEQSGDYFDKAKPEMLFTSTLDIKGSPILAMNKKGSVEEIVKAARENYGNRF